MINSSKDMLSKMAWLNNKKNIHKFTKLEIQKFLYFYEMFQKVSDKAYNIENLKAYVNGPVFSKVYGDITYREDEIFEAVEKAEYGDVDEESAVASFFIIDSMTDTELSQLTHQFDMWKSKSSRIDRGELQIPISETDITGQDEELLKMIFPTYPFENPDFHIIEIQDKKFVVSGEDFQKLTDTHYNTLELLSNEKELFNPVYIEIEEDGGLLVD